MTKLYFLQSKKPVKKFIFSEGSEEKMVTVRARLLDELAKISGELVFELKLKEGAMLMVVMFDNQVLMETWERLVASVTTLNEVETCKVLVIKSTNQEDASKKLETMVRTIHQCQGLVLSIKCESLVERHILLYFSKKESMKRFQEKYTL